MTEKDKNLVVTLWQSGEPIERIIRLLPYPICTSRKYINELRNQGVLTNENRIKKKAIDKVMQLYNSGVTNPYEIADMTGYSFYTVRSALVKAGLDRKRPEHNYKATPLKPYDKISDNSKIIVDLLEQGKGCSEIARLVGCSRQNVFVLKKKFYPNLVKEK